MQNIDALIFDLGGVVVEIDFRRVFTRWAAYAGVSPESIAARFTIDGAYSAHERGEIDAAAFFDAMRCMLGIDISDAQFQEGWNAVFVDEMQDIRGLLQQARELLPLYLFSNTNMMHKQFFLNEYREVLSPFSELFISSDLGLRKPDTAAFRAVAEHIGAPPQRLVFFDDTMENVLGAREAGLKAFHVRSTAEIAAVLRDEFGFVLDKEGKTQ